MPPTPQRSERSIAATASEPATIRVGTAIWLAAFLVAGLTFLSIDLVKTWPKPVVSYSWRVASIVMVVTLASCVRGDLSPSGRFLRLFAPWLAAEVILGLAQPNQAFALADLVRHFIMIFFGACVFAGAQSESGRGFIRLLMWMLVGVLIAISIGPAIELVQMGWSWDGVRSLKGFFKKRGLLVNDNFATFGVLIIGLWPERKTAPAGFWPCAALAFAAGCVFFGVRAPLFSLGFATAAGAAYVWFRRRSDPYAAPPIIAPFALLAVPMAVLVYIVEHPSPDVTVLLTLRSYLWQIAIDVWQQHPIIGSGGAGLTYGQQHSLNAATFDLAWHRDAVRDLGSGGFHSNWLDVLASKGLVGFVGLFAANFLLFRLAMGRAAVQHGAPLLVLLLLLLWRSYVEVGGLFSYQNSALDFISYIVLAYLAALALRDAPAPAKDAGHRTWIAPPRRAHLAPPAGRG
jgi:hypothetical protein